MSALKALEETLLISNEIDAVSIDVIELHAAALEVAKTAEAAAKKDREAIERMILELPEVKTAAKDKGTVNTGPFKIVYKENESWDQEKVEAASEGINPQFFPFKAQWKPDNAAMKVFKERWPDLYKRLEPALTTKPAKPSISIIEEKE